MIWVRGGFHPKNYEVAFIYTSICRLFLFIFVHIYTYLCSTEHLKLQDRSTILSKIWTPLIWMSLKLIVVIAVENTFFM